MRPTDCLSQLLSSSKTILFWGEAGSGKTVLAIESLKKLCRRSCVYVSTEGLDFIKRVHLVGLDASKLLVYEAFDLNDLVEAVVLLQTHLPDAVVVDSINAPYRVEAMYENSSQKLMYVVSSLYALAHKFNIKVLLTGQVHSINGVIEAVGLTLIDPWIDCRVKLEKMGLGIRRLQADRCNAVGGKECCFNIEERGVRWLSRCP